MKQVVHNLRDGDRVRSTALLAPLLLLPLALAGVPAPSYLGAQVAKRQEKAARDGNDYAQSRVQEWRNLGDVPEALTNLRQVNGALADMLPAWQEELVVHGALRAAGERAGLELGRLQMTAPERRGDPLQGLVVVEREISLSGSGTIQGLLNLVDHLRDGGWPTCVHGIDAQVDRARPGVFGFDLRLGIFHTAPAEAFTALPEADAPESNIEEPIQ
ncbi:MAG: hypothetical protein R3F17_00945 [Planctomycetota bacterium]